jgi:hypothetical protein
MFLGSLRKSLRGECKGRYQYSQREFGEMLMNVCQKLLKYLILFIKVQQRLALSDAQSAAGDLPSGGPKGEKCIF